MAPNEPPASRVTTTIQCSDCGKSAEVPFAPTAGRPVYCRECFPKHRAAPSGPSRGGGFRGRGRKPAAKPKVYTRSDYPGYKGPPE